MHRENIKSYLPRLSWLSSANSLEEPASCSTNGTVSVLLTSSQAITRPSSFPSFGLSHANLVSSSTAYCGDRGFNVSRSSPDVSELSIGSERAGDGGTWTKIFTSEREDAPESLPGDFSPGRPDRVTATLPCVIVCQRLRVSLLCDGVGSLGRDRDEALLTGFDLTNSASSPIVSLETEWRYALSWYARTLSARSLRLISQSNSARGFVLLGENTPCFSNTAKTSRPVFTFSFTSLSSSFSEMSQRSFLNSLLHPE